MTGRAAKGSISTPETPVNRRYILAKPNGDQTMTFDDMINGFVAKLQDLYNKLFAERYKNLTAPTVVAQYGSKYVKIVQVNANHGGQSVLAFVARKDGRTKTDDGRTRTDTRASEVGADGRNRRGRNGKKCGCSDSRIFSPLTS